MNFETELDAGITVQSRYEQSTGVEELVIKFDYLGHGQKIVVDLEVGESITPQEINELVVDECDAIQSGIVPLSTTSISTGYGKAAATAARDAVAAAVARAAKGNANYVAIYDDTIATAPRDEDIVGTGCVGLWKPVPPKPWTADAALESHIKVSTKIDNWLGTTTWTIDCIYFNCPLTVTLPTDDKGLTNREINELVANELLPPNKPIKKPTVSIRPTTPPFDFSFKFNSTLGEVVANKCPTAIKMPSYTETFGEYETFKASHDRLQDTIDAQNKIIFERREALCRSIIVGTLEAYGVTLLDNYTDVQITKLYTILPKDVLDTIATAVHLASLEFTERGL